MESLGRSAVPLPKAFNGNNFSTYKSQILSYLCFFEADEILEGKELPPEEPAHGSSPEVIKTYEDKKKLFKKKNALIHATISGTQTAGSDGERLVQGSIPGDGVALWKLFLNSFDPITLASIVHDVKTLINPTTSDSVVTIGEEMKKLRTKIESALTAKNVTLMDVIMRMVFLDAIKRDHEGVSNALALTDKLFDELYPIAIEQTAHLSLPTPSKSSALHSQSGSSGKEKTTENNNKTKGKGKNGEKNYYCTAHGKNNSHNSENCYKLHPHLKKEGAKKTDRSEKSTDNTGIKLGSAWKASSKRASNKDNSDNESFVCMEVDSGSTEHTIRHEDAERLFKINHKCKSVIMVSANQEEQESIGQVTIPDKLGDPLYVMQKWESNLLSVPKLYKEGKATLFHPRYGVVIAPAEDMKVECNNAVAIGILNSNDTFTVNIKVPSDNQWKVVQRKSHSSQAKLSTSREERAGLIFRRTGFNNPNRLITLQKQGAKTDLPTNSTLEDFKLAMSEDAYHQARSKAQPHRKNRPQHRAKHPFEKIHIDIKVVNKPSYSGKRFALLVIDDYTRWKYLFGLKHKDELVSTLKAWYSQEIESNGWKIRTIRADNAGEQKGMTFDQFLSYIKAKVEYTNPYSPASNGIAERALGIIFKTAEAMRLSANLPEAAWYECAAAATYIENRMPTFANPNNKSPYQMIHGKVPDIRHLRSIGSTAYVHDFRPKSALSPSSKVGKMVGYATRTNGYRIMLSSGEVVETAHVTFNEIITKHHNGRVHSIGGNDGEILFLSSETGESSPSPVVSEPPMTNNTNTNHNIPDNHGNNNRYDPLTEEEETEANYDTTSDIHIIQPDSISELLDDALQQDDQLTNDPPAEEEIQRPRRNIKPPVRYDPSDPTTYGKKVIFGSTNRQVRRERAHRVVKAKELPTKISFNDVKKNPQLCKSMRAEITNLVEKGAIGIAKIRPDDKLITSTWVHQPPTEKNPDGKSRLCPHGFKQIPGKHYDENKIESPTPCMETIMIGLAIEVNRSQHVIQKDVHKCFASYAKNDHRVLMHFPPGMKNIPGHALILLHALQGTKQAARLWYEVAAEKLINLGFRRSLHDPCYFSKWIDDKFSQIILWVDDFRISCDDLQHARYIDDELEKMFEMTTTDGSKWVGLSLNHDKSNGILSINSEDYILKLLEDYDMLNCRPVSTPAEPGTKLLKTNATDPEVINYDYRALVGALLWLARTGRPDIMYAVNQLTAHCSNWDSTHIKAAKRVLRYLRGTASLSLKLRKSSNMNEMKLVVYADSDFASEPEGNPFPMRSISGGVITLDQVGTIFALTSLEKDISLSTAEAEYKAIYNITRKLIGPTQFLIEQGFTCPLPIKVLNDNSAANIMSKQDFSGAKTRHIKLRFHYVRECVKDGLISVEYCPTDNMLADIMTKPLERIKFEHFRNMLLNGVNTNTVLIDEL